MAIQVLLKRGSNYIDLDQAPFSVGLDFSPPPINPSYNISSGTSANVNRGGNLISKRHNNRQFSFNLRIKSTSLSVAQTHSRALEAFAYAQSSDPLILEYRTNAAIPVPLWGQFGAPLRYEVVTCLIGKPDELYGPSSGVTFFVPVDLELKPAAGGLQQRAANASGGIYEDTLGTVDGSSRGLAIFEATTNKMTNPVLGNATFGNGWTTDAGLIASQNTDAAFRLPGVSNSAKITCATANAGYYQTINVGNTNKHSASAYIMLPDGGTPTSADCVILYNAVKATTFQNLGNGLWLAYSDNFDGINGNAPVGLYFETAGRTVYLLGFQIEQKAYHTPLCHGDMLGCAWTSTAHASTSTRTGAKVEMSRTEDVLSLAQGAVSVVWKPYHSSTFGADRILFGALKSDYAAIGLLAEYTQADDKITFINGANTIATAAQTFAAGDVLRLLFTWGPGGLNIYKSGVNAATGATYTPTSTNSATVVIGNSTGSGNANGDLSIDVYDTELTAAQALAMDTEIAALVTAGRRVSSIPWLWTKDGNGLLYNCDDVPRDNWCAIGGIAGSLAAKYQHYVDASNYKASYWFGGTDLDLSEFIEPTRQWFVDFNTTANAAYCGGGYRTILATASSVGSLSVAKPHLSYGKSYYFVRLAKAATTGSVAIIPVATAGLQVFYSSAKTLAIDTTQKIYLVGDLTIKPRSRQTLSKLAGYKDYFEISIEADTTHAELIVDYFQVIPGKLARIDWGYTTDPILIFDGASASGVEKVGGVPANYANVQVSGDVLEILPSRLNMLWAITGGHAEAHLLDDTLTFTTYITPQYALL